MIGTLYGVGVGPGDPDLMTLKAIKIVENADIIAVPNTMDSERVAWNIVKQAVPAIEDTQILDLYMPMSRDKQLLKQSHDNAACAICEKLEEGKNVVFLTLGDPTIYSTYIYVDELVRKRGYQAVIIPGVPSFCAVAAELGISLTKASEPLHIIPGSYDCLDDNLSLDGTKVLMKSGKSLQKVIDKLRGNKLSKHAHMVQNCGMKNQKVYHSLEECTYDPDYFSIVVVKTDNVKETSL